MKTGQQFNDDTEGLVYWTGQTDRLHKDEDLVFVFRVITSGKKIFLNSVGVSDLKPA